MAGAISLATAAGSAYLSYEAAQQRNRAIERSQESRAQAAGVQRQQLAETAAVECKKRLNEAAMIRGRLRVSGGERGTGEAGSQAALLRQLDFDVASNEALLSRNLLNQRRAVSTGAEADLIALSAGLSSPLIDAFSGGVQGAQTGLSIGQGIRSATGSAT